MHPSEKPETIFPPCIVLLGGPGSGKGTHGQAVADALGIQHLSSGEHFREQIQKETPLGLQAKALIEKGRLAPDTLANALIRDLLTRQGLGNGWVLDGYPRSLPQAEALTVLLGELGLGVSFALYLRLDDEEIKQRLSGRLTCRACGQTFHELFNKPKEADRCDNCGGDLFRRNDDEPATIRNRIEIFHEMIGPLLDYYKKSGLLSEVDVSGPVDVVRQRVTEQVALLLDRSNKAGA